MTEHRDPIARRYVRYWRVDQPPPATDPLSAPRRCQLWRRIDALGLPSVRLLDAGCGSGELIAEASARGIRAAGMDVSPVALEQAGRRDVAARFNEHSVESLPWPFEEGEFDVVASFEVIEHLLEPTALLEGARDVLAPNGHLALTTPYHGLAKNLLISALHFEKHFDVDGDHIRFFTDRSLRRMLEESGFENPKFMHMGRTWPLWENTFVWTRRR